MTSPISSPALTLSAVNACSESEFLAALGGLFEHSPWVAQAVIAQRPFPSVEAMHAAMIAAVKSSQIDRQLALLNAHPDLAGKLARAGAVTDHSIAEQSGLGLNRLSEAEFQRFDEANRAYRARFGFPFIIAARANTKDTILAAFERRLANDAETERLAALAEVAKITQYRLHDMMID
jgi:2-oxo-4-hydroxy-4-carboxy-5-ureidoimidazoline decarboxylase